MSKAGNRKTMSSAVREPDQPHGVLLFEVDRRKLRTLLGRRVVRRRALADNQRRMLPRLIVSDFRR